MPRPSDDVIFRTFAFYFTVLPLQAANELATKGRAPDGSEMVNQLLAGVRADLQRLYDYDLTDEEFVQLTKDPRWMQLRRKHLGPIGAPSLIPPVPQPGSDPGNKQDAEQSAHYEFYANLFICVVVVASLVGMAYLAYLGNADHEALKARLNDPAKIPMFIQDIRGDDDAKRGEAVYGFELLGERATSAAPEVAKGLSDKRPEVRRATIRALRPITDDPEIRRQMRQMQKDDPDPDVRATVEKVLGN